MPRRRPDAGTAEERPPMRPSPPGTEPAHRLRTAAAGSSPLRVALIDPSLFTLPYDVKLADALRGIGHGVTFYGKTLAPAESVPERAQLVQHFYPEMLRWGLWRWPAGAAKLAKGALHLRSMRHLLEVLRGTRPDIIHFQWLPLPVIDRAFIGELRRIAPLVLTAHDSRPFNTNPSSIIQKLGATAVLGRFDRVIVHTEQARNRLAQYGVEPARIARIAHGFLHD